MGKLLEKKTGGQSATVETYEDRLSHNPGWALSEASDYFLGRGDLKKTLRRITSKLDELNVSYAVAGGLALFSHGFRRFTEDVNILVSRESLARIHAELEGLGYVAPFAGSKNLRDTDTGVRIEFLITGQFPGDGKPKPVAFPEPSSVYIESDGIKYLNLHALLELKLASGMTNPHRGKDLIDVQEVIRSLNLPRELSEKLNPFVRSKYDEIWKLNQIGRRRFIKLWQHDLPATHPNSLDELIQALRAGGKPTDAELLATMQSAGIILDANAVTESGWSRLSTDDPDIAAKYDMHAADEFLDPE